MAGRLLRTMTWTSAGAWIGSLALVVMRLTPREEPVEWLSPVLTFALTVSAVATIVAALAYFIPSTFQAWSDGFDVGRRVEHDEMLSRGSRHLRPVR